MNEPAITDELIAACHKGGRKIAPAPSAVKHFRKPRRRRRIRPPATTLKRHEFCHSTRMDERPPCDDKAR